MLLTSRVARLTAAERLPVASSKLSPCWRWHTNPTLMSTAEWPMAPVFSKKSWGLSFCSAVEFQGSEQGVGIAVQGLARRAWHSMGTGSRQAAHVRFQTAWWKF